MLFPNASCEVSISEWSCSVSCSTSEILDSTAATSFLTSSARLLTSPATTAKPFPCSPAFAASIEAFNARIFVCSAIEVILLVHFLIFWTAVWKSSKVLFISLKCSSTFKELFFNSSTSSCAWFTDWLISPFTDANWLDTSVMLEKVSPKLYRVSWKCSDSLSTPLKEEFIISSWSRESTSFFRRSRW